MQGRAQLKLAVVVEGGAREVRGEEVDHQESAFATQMLQLGQGMGAGRPKQDEARQACLPAGLPGEGHVRGFVHGKREEWEEEGGDRFRG